MLKQAFENALSGGKPIELLLTCAACAKGFVRPFPLESANKAVLEAQVASGRVIDVLFSLDDAPRLGVEVFASHAVDAAKAADLTFPWIELKAEAIVKNPHLWSVRAGKLKSTQCPRCKMIEIVRWEHLDRALQDASLKRLPGYRIDPVPCYRCTRSIPIFRWGANNQCSDHPPQPQPATLKRLVADSTGEHYWTNSCPHCRAIQSTYKVSVSIRDHALNIGDEADARLAPNKPR